MKLTSDLVPDTRHHRLALMIEPAAVEVVLHSTVEDNSLIHARIALDATITDHLRAVEEAIYANPLLLNGCFGRVDCLCHGNSYAMVPAQAAADDDRLQAMAEALFGHDAVAGGEVICDDVDGVQSLAFCSSESLVSFLRRTFSNPTIHHRVTPLLRYFRGQRHHSAAGKMYVHFSPGRVDVIVYGNDTVKFVNTFNVREPLDAVYYILAARKLCQLSADTDELILAGDAESRKAVMPLLRRYVAKVLPAIFPSALYRAGREALTSPFELTVLPLL